MPRNAGDSLMNMIRCRIPFFSSYKKVDQVKNTKYQPIQISYTYLFYYSLIYAYYSITKCSMLLGVIKEMNTNDNIISNVFQQPW